jgi:PAS domain S-box-containing protein
MSYGTSESIGAQAAKLEALLQSAATAIVIIDAAGTIETINPATARMFGYEPAELIGQNIKILMPDNYRAEHDKYLSNYLTTGIKKIIGIGREVSGRRKDGAIFPIHLAVGEFSVEDQRYFTGIIHDLSDRKHVEEALKESERRLAQAQKMEAIGQLTGGIAHDFNNLLTIITGNLELVHDQLERDDLRQLVKKAQDAAELGAQLTNQLLSFARRRSQEVQTLRLNELLLSVMEMLRRTLGDHISLSSSFTPDLWETEADSSQFQNAIVNLAVNARDAMPKGGRLIIETRNAILDAGQLGDHLDVEPGHHVQLSISDTGTGMPPEVRERAFEPFFTTKDKGRGTGLGLAMVYGFVKQSGGHITIYSELGHGTTFNLYLPRTGNTTAPVLAPAGSDTAAFLSRGIVLLVEDDPGVRELTVTRLKAIGYEVLEAVDGRKAAEVLRSDAPVDLVFTDLVMPGGLSGRDVAVMASEIRPGIKVLLTSGYAEDLVLDDDPDLAQLRILRKPYRQADLVAALREVFINPTEN